MRRRGFGLAIVLLSSMACSPVAAAQDVMVVTASIGGRAPPEIEARLSAALEARGVTVAATDGLPARLGLEAFVPAPRGLAAELGRVAETVLELVASGETSRAVSLGEPIIERAREHLAALGRDAQASTDLANLCLYLARADLASQGDAAAAERIQSCFSASPDLPANERMHPPAVRDLVARVRADIDAASTVLVVRARPGEPADCAIRLNGRPVGRTPELRTAVVPGTYALQIECGPDPSPVHEVEAAAGSVQRIMSSPSLDSVLRIYDGRATLVYASAEQASERLVADAGTLAASTNGGEVLAVLSDAGNLRIHRIAVSRSRAPRAVADTTVTANAPDAALASALDSLFDPARTDTETRVAHTETDTSRPILGPALLGAAGLAGLGVLAYGLVATGCADEDASGRCIENANLSVVPAILYGGLGAAAVIGAVVWFAIGGSDNGEPDDVTVGVGPRNIDVVVAF